LVIQEVEAWYQKNYKGKK